MKQTIRHGTFETNSSSMHSLVLMKKAKQVKDEGKPKRVNIVDNEYTAGNHFDEYNVYLNEYDRWPFQILNTPIKKAMYILASKCKRYGDETYTAVVDAIRKIYPDFEGVTPIVHTSYKYKGISEVQGNLPWEDSEETVKLNENSFLQWDENFGYVDWQSSGLINKALTDGVTIEEIITDPRYVIYIDGDEYYELSKMIKSGIINILNIEKSWPDLNDVLEEEDEDSFENWDI